MLALHVHVGVGFVLGRRRGFIYARGRGTALDYMRGKGNRVIQKTRRRKTVVLNGFCANIWYGYLVTRFHGYLLLNRSLKVRILNIFRIFVIMYPMHVLETEIYS